MAQNSDAGALRLSGQSLPEIRKRDVHVFDYDRAAVKHGIVHVGVGGFHRAHLAVYIDRILTQFKDTDWAICGVGLTPWDSAMRDALTPQDTLYTVMERGAQGTQAHVIGAITDYIFAPGNSEEVIAKMAHPDTHIVSMTITEGGYFYNENTHELVADHPDIQADLAAEVDPKTIFGYLYQALVRRRDAGLKPFTVLSCDNMQGNGSITRKMLLAFAKLKNPEIAAWLEKNGAFPNSMVDRITPRTADSDKELLKREFGVEDAWPVVTEPFMQWVLEDQFADGRPPFEKVGVQVVEGVHQVEQFEMHKLRLLNGSHSAIAYLGFLAGIKYVDEVLADPKWHSYVSTMMHTEVKPLLPAIPGVDIDKYCETLLSRFSNPTLKDEIARLCIGGSGKLPQFIMPSIAEQIMRRNKTGESGDGAPLRLLVLALAGWFRYLSGTDEQGNKYVISPISEPEIGDLQPLAIEGGRDPTKLIGVRHLFGDDLRGDERFMKELNSALGSLYDIGARKTLEAYL